MNNGRVANVLWFEVLVTGNSVTECFPKHCIHRVRVTYHLVSSRKLFDDIPMRSFRYNPGFSYFMSFTGNRKLLAVVRLAHKENNPNRKLLTRNKYTYRAFSSSLIRYRMYPTNRQHTYQKCNKRRVTSSNTVCGVCAKNPQPQTTFSTIFLELNHASTPPVK